MRQPDARMLSACAAVAAFALAYRFSPRGPFYLPLRHTWAWHTPPEEIGMGWYAKLCFAALAALLVYGVLRLLLGRLGGQERAPGSVVVYGASVGVVLVWLWTAAVIAWQQLAHL